MKNLVSVFLFLGLIFCLSSAATAATYTVTKIADTNDGACDADCSLREAVAAANATAADDSIEFAAAIFGTAQTIVLSGTDIIITNNGKLIIEGTGANLLTVSGNGASRVFTNNTGAITEIRNLRVTGGNGGSTVNNNLGGAIRNTGGNLSLTNLVVTGSSATNGGGVSNGGTGSAMTITNCTLSNNTTTTGTGGAIQNFSSSTMIVSGTTFSDNTSNSDGLAGGAMQANGMLNISNSTFSGNKAPNGSAGAIYYNGTGLTMNNVTITNNSSLSGAGGLHKTTSNLNANLRNTLIAGNTGASTTPDALGAFNSQGNNLIGAVGTSTGWVGSDILNQAAQLGTLANNGGATQTHALLTGSPAINAGQNCVTDSTCAAANPTLSLTTDQRGTGFPRLVGASVDIGAFELGSTVVPRPAEFDFDGDFKADYSVFRPSSGVWYLNRSTLGQTAVQFGIASDRLVPADYDGDGKTDIAVWRAGGFAYFYILQSSNNTVRIEQFGIASDNPAVVGNWDGDNKADLAIYRGGAAGSGQSYFYYRPSSQPNGNFVTIPWGTGGDEPLRGDFDADGKADAAVYRPSNNIWYILQSSNNQLRAESWGISSDKRVSGDFDGDAKTDLAIWRDGLWAIRQSSNGAARYEQFGLTGDRLTPADYDADGKTDLSVWRNGIFYTLRSNGGQTEAVQYGTTGDVPIASAFIP